MIIKLVCLLLVAIGSVSLATHAFAAEPKENHYRASDVFDSTQKILFQDDFHSGQFGKWTFSEDDRYRLAKPTPERVGITDAPQLSPGLKAVACVVRHNPNEFRAEISLPHESGFQERWYGERIFVPANWDTQLGGGNDIVMQWHAIPGNGKATHPNLAISIDKDRWVVRQNFGNAQGKHTQATHQASGNVVPGTWVCWVIHAKWSPIDAGILQIWKDGQPDVDVKGANVYATIGVEYTPYLKTGIYHPSWHSENDEKSKPFDTSVPATASRTIYVTDIKVGDPSATYADVAPPGTPAPAESAK